MKPTSRIAVLFGSGVGVAAAVGGFLGTRCESSPPPSPESARSIAEKPGPKAPAEPVPEPKQAAPASSPTDFPAEGDPPITSKADFEVAVVACDKKDAGACRRAASAVELGEVVPKDLERAKTFRKVELTVLVRGCEKGAVEECLTLADRYLRGDGLAQNERTATALIEHARELCSRNPVEACRSVPKTP
jgi:TPR repeat protein